MPNGGIDCRGVKNRNFRPISRFISEIIQDRAIVNVECDQETAPNIRMLPFLAERNYVVFG